MSKEIANSQEPPEQLSEILLVLDKEQKKIQAVKSINENGEMETVDPMKKNENQFMRVDNHGNLFSNFFSNFISQLKNPTNFSFFKVPKLVAIDMAKEMQQQVDKPTPEGEKLMKEHELKKDIQQEQQKNQQNMETTKTMQQEKTNVPNEYRYQPDQIDWETMNNLGLGKEKLEKMNLLEPLLKGYKTNELVSVSLNLGTVITKLDARLSLQTNEKGQVVAAIHGIRKEPNLNFEFFGHKFTDEDKKNLLHSGNMGRVVDLINTKTGEKIPSIISVDRLTNELIALRTEYIKIPDEIKGVKLNNEQKQVLMEGKPLFLEGMLSKKNTEFSAMVQFNADKRYVEFLFDRDNTKKQTQANKQDAVQSQPKEAPSSFRGKELDKEQYESFKNGQTIYLKGLIDKKGNTYQGYVTYNKEKGTTEFSFKNPDKLKVQAKPTEEYKTQTAVNSEGKTNEATNNIKEPLKTAQQRPRNTQQKEMQEKPKAPVKSRSKKM